MVNGTLASSLAGIASKALWRESHSRLLDIFIHKCILLRGLIGLTKGRKDTGIQRLCSQNTLWGSEETCNQTYYNITRWMTNIPSQIKATAKASSLNTTLPRHHLIPSLKGPPMQDVIPKIRNNKTSRLNHTHDVIVSRFVVISRIAYITSAPPYQVGL
jgi:hypothetical protein